MKIFRVLFFEDEQGNLWVTTIDALHCYNRKKDTFERLAFENDTLDLRNDYHAFYFNKKNNEIWLKTGDRMWAYDIKSKTSLTNFYKTSGYRFTIDTSGTGELNKIFAFPWLNKPGFEFWVKSTSGEWKMRFYDQGVLSETKISEGVIENDSTLWLVSNLGLTEFDVFNKKVRNHYTANERNVYRFWNGVFYKKNVLLLSSHNAGLWSFNTKRKKFSQNWTYINKDETGISSDQPINLFMDRDSQLWVSQKKGGVDFTTLSLSSFSNPLKNEETKLHVRNIAEDQQGRIWVLTIERGIFVYDLNQKLLFQFEKMTNSVNSIGHLSLDQKGRIWIIAGGEIYKYIEPANGKSANWELIYKGDEKLKSIYHGLPDNSIVIGVNGVYSLDESESKLLRHKLFENYNQFEFNYFFKANNTTTFIPFNRQDVWMLSHDKNELSFNDTTHLNFATHNVLQSRDKNKIWLAGSNGLLEYSKGGQAHMLIDKESLGEFSSIYSLVEDNAGRLWFTTDNGIWSFNTSNNELLKYTQTNGLFSGLLFRGPGILASNGTIWFEHENGLSVFNPDSIKLPATNNAAYINNMWVNNKEHSTNSDLNEVGSIELKHYENTLDFELRILDIHEHEDGLIQYRLKNYNEDWTTRKNGGIAGFTKKTPGQYQLEFRPINRYNQAGKTSSLNILMPPPIWQTWWFQLLMFLLFMLAIALGIRLYYLRKLRFQKRELEKQKLINEERNRIGKELHDDIGGSLSSIRFISEDVLLDEKESMKKGQLERISELTQSTLVNMKDIIWALDTNQSSLEDLVVHLRHFASAYLLDHQLLLEFDSKLFHHEHVILSSGKKRNLFLIAKECLHNIVKHAGAKKVSIKVYNEKQNLVIEIADDGKGFEIETIKSEGHGLRNIQERTSNVDGKVTFQSIKNVGTSMTLHVPL